MIIININELKEIIPGSGYYVSRDGVIYSSNANKGTKFIRKATRISNSGYEYVMVTIGKPKIFYVHRLVATAFIDNPENKEQVNHINGNKLKNNVENLEWVTQSENCSHYRESLLQHGKTGANAGFLYRDGLLVDSFRSLQQAKIFCKENFQCSLSTSGPFNCNVKNKIVYIRNKSTEKEILDALKQFEEYISSQKEKVSCRIKQEKGFSGKVYKAEKLIGEFASLREANDFCNVDFKKTKQKNIYKAKDYLFIKDETQ